jgi:hypothetical protein
MKKDPPLEPSRRIPLAPTPVNGGSVRRPLADFSGGGDLKGAGGGVLAPLGDGLPSLGEEQMHLVPLLSSIDCK